MENKSNPPGARILFQVLSRPNYHAQKFAESSLVAVIMPVMMSVTPANVKNERRCKCYCGKAEHEVACGEGEDRECMVAGEAGNLDKWV